jgi:hypothetical protein
MLLINIMLENEHEFHLIIFFCSRLIFFTIHVTTVYFSFGRTSIFELRTKTRFFSTIVNFIIFKAALSNCVRRRDFFRQLYIVFFLNLRF